MSVTPTIPRTAPANANDALRRLEAVRGFCELVAWSHELRASGLLGEDGYTNDEVRFWGRIWPGEVPPQAFSPNERDVYLPSGELVEWVGDWQHGQWKLVGTNVGPWAEVA